MELKTQIPAQKKSKNPKSGQTHSSPARSSTHSIRRRTQASARTMAKQGSDFSCMLFARRLFGVSVGYFPFTILPFLPFPSSLLLSPFYLLFPPPFPLALVSVAPPERPKPHSPKSHRGRDAHLILFTSRYRTGISLPSAQVRFCSLPSLDARGAYRGGCCVCVVCSAGYVYLHFYWFDLGEAEDEVTTAGVLDLPKECCELYCFPSLLSVRARCSVGRSS